MNGGQGWRWRTVDGHRSTPFPSFSPRPPNPCHVPPRFTLVFEPVAAITGNSGVSSATIPTAIALYNALHPSGEYVLTTCRQSLSVFIHLFASFHSPRFSYILFLPFFSPLFFVVMQYFLFPLLYFISFHFFILILLYTFSILLFIISLSSSRSFFHFSISYNLEY